MLQLIRERVSGVFAVFIIALIGIPLVITFGNMEGGAGSGQFAAKVNGEEIPRSYYQRVYQNQLLTQQQRFQGELPATLIGQLKRSVLESLVRGRSLVQFVEEQGYRVSDARVAETIQGMEVFQVGGEFSSPSYVATLASQGLTPAGFEREQRQSMELRQFEGGIIASSFYTPTEYRRYIELERELRSADFVLFDSAALAAQAEVTDEQIQAYYDENAASFQTDESVDLEFVEVTLDAVGSDVEVSEQEVRAFYESNIDRYRTANERRARHILIAVDADTDEAAAEALAREIRGRMDNGESFADLAREYSDDPGSAESGGDLGWAGEGVYVGPFEEALFALTPGQISEPVATEFGYHIIEVMEVRAGTQQSFEKVRGELETELRASVLEDRFFALAERVDELALENPGSLQAVTEGTGLSLGSASGFTRSGGPPLGFNRDLVDAAFSLAVLEDGENSPLIELADDRAVVVRVVDHRLPQPRPLEEIRDEIVAALKFEQGATLASELGNALRERLADGEDFSALAKEFEIELQSADDLSRDNAELPPDLLGGLFRAAAGTIDGLPLSNGGYAVFRLRAVEPGRPEDVPRQQRDQRKNQLAQQIGSGSAAAVASDVRAGAKVVVTAGLFEDPEQDL